MEELRAEPVAGGLGVWETEAGLGRHRGLGKTSGPFVGPMAAAGWWWGGGSAVE